MNKQLIEMLEMQNKLNADINPNWLTDDSQDWLLAAMVEGVEMIDHYGWKWWAKQERDMPQVKLELVDIWHFIMSAELKFRHTDFDDINSAIFVASNSLDASFQSVATDRSFMELAKDLVGMCAEGGIPNDEFADLMANVSLSFDDLYKWYIGKNTLCAFRQANGYKEGTYVKIWGGVEDNVHLASFLNGVKDLDNLADIALTFLDNVYQGLPK